MNKKIFLTIIGVLFVVLSVFAEFDLNEAQGFLPNQKYLIDTENINLCNGNVNINSAEVSLILNSETSIPLSRVYNSKIWTTHQIPIYQDNPDGSKTQIDLKLQVGLVSNYESFHSFGLGWELGIPRISECWENDGYSKELTFYSPSGGRHEIKFNEAYDKWLSDDGSFYFAENNPDLNHPQIEIYDKSGMKYVFEPTYQNYKYSEIEIVDNPDGIDPSLIIGLFQDEVNVPKGYPKITRIADTNDNEIQFLYSKDDYMLEDGVMYFEIYLPNLGDGAWHNPNSIFDLTDPSDLPNPSYVRVKCNYIKTLHNGGYLNTIIDRAGNVTQLTAEGNEFDPSEKFLITEMNYRNHLSEEIQIKYSYSDAILENPFDNIEMIDVENFRELILDLNRYYDFIPVTRKILTKMEIKKDDALLLPSVEYSYSDKGHLNKRKLSTGGEIYYDYGIYTRQIKEYSFNKWQIINSDPMPAYINSFRLVQKRRGNSIWGYSIFANPFSDPITHLEIENSFFTKWEVPEKVMVIMPDNTRTISYFEARESLTKETSCKAGTLLKEEYYSPLGKELLKTIEYSYTPNISLPCNFLLTTKIVKQGKTYREEYSYDKYNNITEFKQFGDYDDLNDNFTQKKAYLHSDNTAYIGKFILDRPISNMIYHEGALINKSLVEYDAFALETYGLDNPDNLLRGNVTKVTQKYGIMNSLGMVSSWDVRKDLVTQTYYDIHGNTIKEVDSKNNETLFEYDVLKRLFPVKITNSLGHEVLTQYHDNGLVENITDINGNITNFQYDTLDRLVKTVNPDGSEKDITYSDFFPDLWTKIEDSIDAARKFELTYFFDQYGRFTNNKVKVEDGQYIENSVTYDDMDRKSTYTNPLGGISRYSYDSLGRIIKVTNPDGTFAGTKYLDSENAVEVFDENGHKIKHYFNAYQKLIKVDEFNDQNQLYATSNYTYDVLGNLLKIKDSNEYHSVAQYYYDTFGRIRATDQPDSGRTYYSYDKNSNLIWQKDAKNQETTFTYDELNRMLQIVYQDGHTITNEYDSASISNGLGKIYRTDKNVGGQITESIIINNYDVMGRPDNEEYQIPGYNINTVHDFTYNLAGQVTDKTFTYNTELLKDLSFSYDFAGRMLNTYDNIESRELVDYNYNDLSLVTKQNNFNGTSSEYTYHPTRYWMTDLKVKKGAEVLYQNQYQYDDVGNRSKLIDEFGTETSYSYDGLYRLTGVQGSYYKRSDGAYNTYSYDTTGNRMQYNSMFNDYEYQYATDSNRLLIERSMNGIEILSYLDYQYDANGNTTHKIHHTELFESGKEEYLWNCENQMIGYRKFNKNIKSHLFDLTDAVDFQYNMAGTRLSKKVYNTETGILNESVSTLYLYEGSEVELELAIYNDDTLSKKTLFYYGLGKKLCSKSFKDDGTLESERIYHQDILGNNILLTDNTGGWVEKTTYGPFGDEISNQRRDKSIESPNRYNYTGKERDRESNLDYFGARYLDYNNGRWMKPDVVKGKLINPQSLNRNIYGQNRPLFFIDIGGNDVYVFYWGFSFQNPKGHVAVAVEVVLRGNLQLFLFATNPPEVGRTLRDLKEGVPVNKTIGQNIDPESMDEYTGEVAGQKPKGILRINTDGLANGLSGDQIYDIFLGGISEEEIYDLDENNCAHYVVKMLEKIGVDLQIKGVITPRKVKKAIKKYNKKQQRRKETKKRITAWHKRKAEEFYGDNSDFREALYQKTMHD